MESKPKQPTEDKNYLYHMVNTDKDGNVVREGDSLHPLNTLKTMEKENPQLYEVYQKVIRKYKGREFIPELTVPTLENTKWGDVVQLMPMHPDDLITALNKAGFKIENKKFYQVDPDSLDPKLTTVFLYDNEDTHNYADFDKDKIKEHSVVPERVIERYKKVFKKLKEGQGEKFDPAQTFGYFVGIPHYFYKGSIDVSDIENFPVITAKLREEEK